MNRSLQRFSLKSLYNGLGIFIFIFSQWAYAQCPTVTNASQSFCNTESPTIANLNAINNGGGVAWFSSTTSTTPLSSGAGLVNGATYYADNAAGNCGTRQPVTVTIYAAPTGQNFQGVCVDNPLEATIANLIANGNNIRWYTTPSGGTTLPTTTVLTDNTIYYASQTNPDTGCETSRLAVFVNVGVVPVPTGPAIQSFCLLPGNTPTVANLQASGLNNWYATVSSVVVLDPATPLINGETYYATTVDPPCESVNRLEITVQLLPPTDAGTDGTLALCSNALTVNPNRNLFSILGGSPQTTGTWSGPLPTSNGHLGIVNISTLTAAGSPHVFTYTVTNAACPPDTATVTITVSNPVNAGNDATLTVCSNNPSVNLFPLLGTTAQAGGIWSPPLASGTGVFNPAVDPSGTYTYTVTGPNACGNDTAIVTVTVNTAANAGTSANTTVCALGPSVNLFTILGGTPQSGGVWSPTLASGTGVFNPLVDAPGTYTYTVTGIPPCTNSSANVTVALTPGITPVFTQRPPICQGATLTALSTTSNNGITGTWSPALNNTTTTTYTFTPTAGQCATTATMTITVNPNIVPTFTQVPPICQGATLTALPTTSNNGITGTWSPALNNTATTTYTFTPTAGQCATTATMTITVNPNIVPTFTQVPPICQGATLAALPTTSNNGITGTWSPALNNTATTTYTFTPTAGQCATTATMTITVNPNIVPTFTQVAPICQGATLAALPTTSNNGITGTWSPALNNTATTTYTFTPTAGQCATTATMTITVNPNIVPTFTQVPPICQGATLTALPTTSNNGITGTWSPALNNTATTTYTFTPTAGQCATIATMIITVNPNIVPTFTQVPPICQGATLTALPTTSNNGITGTWSPALNNTTTTTYTFTPSSSLNCEVATTMTITVVPLPNAGNDGTLVLCSNATPTDLFLSLGGTPQAGGTWTPALASGTGLFNPAVDTAGTYTYTVVGGAPCGSDTATVSVSITPAPNAGTDGVATFCADSAPADLFTFLGGTPQAGGTWTPALASGTGVFNPAVDTAGVYTYTVTGNAPCANGTASATVTVNPIPNAGNDGTLVLCSNATPTDLFLSLGGTPQAGGTWTPALASGTGLFNPAVDTAGTYTYTVVGGAPCGSDTATVNVSITPAPNAGTDGVATFCADSAPADLFTFLGGTPQAGGTWTPALASGTGVFNPAVDTAGVYTYTVTGNAPCANGTASATVTVNPIPNAGNDGTIVLCSNATPTDLFLSLGGTPQAGGTWTPALASGTGLFNPAVDTAGTYTYTVVGGAPCGSDTSTVSVTLTPGPNAGVDATVTLCSNATPIDLFLSLGSSAQSGGTWSPPLASGTGIFNPAFDPAGTYIYTVPGTGTCNPDTATLTVNLIAPPDFGLGIITAPNICQNSAVIVAISGATTLADGNYTFTYSVTNASPSTGTTATVAITAGNGQFTIPASYFQTSGNVTIALTAVTALNGNCTSTISTASTTITVLPQPTLSNATVLVASLCLGEQATVTITGATGLTNGNYTLDYQLSGANTGTFSSSVIFTNGAASFTIPTSDLANAGTVNITLTSIISQITTCGNSTLNFTPITFEVQDPQPPVLTGSTTFCNDSNATLTDLSAQLSGSGTIVWYSSASGGTPLDPTTVVQDGITYYGAVQSSAGCESTRLELTVVLESCTPDDIIIPDGFSPNTDGVNDEFIIKNLLELYPNFTLEIFNRYGNVLFKGNRSNPHWNGRSTEGSVGAGLAPAGVYFFILEFNDGVRAPIQGRLYLSR
ncbi:gliding motility-associated C-terminal domain-containing protein [Flavobacterium sp.]|uniref:T9SS type B sorting domain-containing protein n=1 Tax=Flavobacterium sp. TaxID=239 RepID=UPI0022C3709D|nr:gliding motility-associated C-terminal domain-containing protein [Flavobacterium sp.]MCZ8169457.1 gliding motility-associated C-terminal domain-containing protein [Flavobacterium sp.]